MTLTGSQQNRTAKKVSLLAIAFFYLLRGIFNFAAGKSYGHDTW